MTNKNFYQIGQICELTGLAHSTIRFWELKFSEIRPSRSSGGHRYYTHEQLELIFYLKKLLHDEKYTIEGAKKRLSYEKKTGKSAVSNSISNDKPLDIDKKYIKKELEEILDILNGNLFDSYKINLK